MAELRYVDWDGLVYYDSKIKAYIADKQEECLKYLGERDSIVGLPDPSYNTLNSVYKITSGFEVALSNGDFAPSARGKIFAPNTLICVTDFDSTYLYSILSEPSQVEDVDLSDYYTKSEVEELIPNTDNFITAEDVSALIPSEFVTEDELADAISKIEHPTVDLDGYATEEFVNKAIESIEIPDISGKADKSTTLSGYGITDAYTRTEIDTKLLEIESGGKIDEETLKGFVSEDEWNERIGAYALKTDIPTDYLKEVPDEYITETELNAKGYLTEHQDLSDYALRSEIPDVSKFITAEEIPNYIPNEYVTEDELATLATKEELEAVQNVAGQNSVKLFQVDSDLVDINAKLDTIPTKTSELTNDSNFLTEHQDLSAYALKSEIPTDYIKEIPSEYITETELESKGYLTQHQSLEGYAKISDIPDVSEFIKEIPDEYVTESELSGKGYITSIPDDYAKKSDIPTDYLTSNDLEGYSKFSGSYNDLTDKPTIPSVEGLASEQYVDDAIAGIDIPKVDNFVTTDTFTNALVAKANDVPFSEDYRVGTPMGGFIANDTLQGMTVAQILTKLLGLTLYVPTELPEGTPEEVVPIINEKKHAYVLDENGALIEATNDEDFYRELTESDAKADNQEESFFYQILNDSGEVIESGYHVSTVYQENDYLTILIPNSITNFHPEVYDAGAGDWATPTWNLVTTESYAVDGYTAYTVPAEFEILSGIAVRIVIDE